MKLIQEKKVLVIEKQTTVSEEEDTDLESEESEYESDEIEEFLCNKCKKLFDTDEDLIKHNECMCMFLKEGYVLNLLIVKLVTCECLLCIM